MQNVKRLVQSSRVPFISAVVAFLLVGCQSDIDQSGVKITVTTPTPAVTAPAPAIAAPVAPSAPAAPAVIASAAPMAAGLPIRIDAGATAPYTDSNGNIWLPDQGFVDGDVVDRGNDLQIANTQDQAIYRTERYGMSSFSYKLPNGKYIVKLHFAETYEDITGAGQRVFSFNVAGHEFKDFDVWAKAGGAKRAYIETVNVDITDGKLDITFTTNIQSPEINGIEIIPGS
jgi:Di-glucose binding within endoplasmic reticulum.